MKREISRLAKKYAKSSSAALVFLRKDVSYTLGIDYINNINSRMHVRVVLAA